MRFTSLTCLILLVACTSRTPEQQFVEDAVTAIGGREPVQAVSTVILEGRGTAGNLGQDMTWEATGQSFTLTEFRRVIDLAGTRARTEQTRTPGFLYFQGPQPQRQVFGFDGDVAYAIAPNGNASRQSATIARDRRLEFHQHPLTIVRAMLDPATRVANLRASDGVRTADVTIGDTTYAVSLEASGLPASVSAPGTHPNMGDVTVTTTFAEYQPAGELLLPRRLTTDLDRHVIAQVQVERYAFEGASADAATPAGAASAALPAPAAPVVEAVQVSPGVWHLTGQSHHSALVEFADHLVLIEAPQSEARTRAVLAKARELVPAKPLTALVMSHHHFDHSAGLRAAVSEGLAVIAHKSNTAFVEEMIQRPHTRQPDALQQNPKPLNLRGVDGELVLRDAQTTMMVYPITGNPHGDTMLMVYLPAARVLIQADAFSPGGAYHPYAPNLLDAIRSRQLRVERIVPLHGTIVPLDELVKAVSAGEPR